MVEFGVTTILALWYGVGTQAFSDCLKVGPRFLLTERMRRLLQWLLIRKKKSSPALPSGRRLAQQEDE